MSDMGAKKSARLVIAEDDDFVRQLLAAYFEKEGIHVSLTTTGRELLATLDTEAADVVLLDLGLPDEDGLVLMRQIRARSRIPVVVLTARQGREDRISALEMGADDYLTKPCDPEELVLRVRNVLARSKSEDIRQASANSTIQFGSWEIDLDARSLVDPEGNQVHVSRTEFNLLAALAKSPNRVLSRAQLLDAIAQHDETPSERMIDVLVARLRSKIEHEPKCPKLIVTMVGLGYKFVPDAKKSA